MTSSKHSDGAFDGCSDVIVGILDGCDVGAPVGILDGCDVGASEGAAEGMYSLHTQHPSYVVTLSWFGKQWKNSQSGPGFNAKTSHPTPVKIPFGSYVAQLGSSTHVFAYTPWLIMRIPNKSLLNTNLSLKTFIFVQGLLRQCLFSVNSSNTSNFESDQ